MLLLTGTRVVFYTSEYIAEEPDAVLFINNRARPDLCGVGLVTDRSTTIVLTLSNNNTEGFTNEY